MPVLDFEQTLAALMAKLDERVRISLYSPREQNHSQVADMEGVLTASWDPDVLRENGFEDSAIFRIADAPGFALYLLKDDFTGGKVEGDRIHVRTGGMAFTVSPPLGL